MIVDGEVGFVVDNRDVDAIAKKINRLYNDKDLLKSMSQKALEFYKDYQLSDNNYVMQMADLYKEVENEYKKH